MNMFLAKSNLYTAAGLSAIVTMMSLGRLMDGMDYVVAHVLLTFCVMMFVAGAVTAWGRCAGMAGVLTDRRRFACGAVVAIVLSLLLLPVNLMWIDPVLRDSIPGGGASSPLAMAFPSSMSGRISLLMWSAGFHALFLQAAPMSLFARLSGRQSIALLLTVMFRAFVTAQQVAATGMTEGVWLFHVSAMLTNVVGCLLFARFGLVPAMLFGAGATLHVFLGGGQ